MGNSKSKKAQKEPDRFFDRERWREQKREEKRKKNANLMNRRVGKKEPVLPVLAPGPPPGPGPSAPPPAHVRSYDEDAVELMRYQLHNDTDAFLLNNILLSVQFFENYEREVHYIKNNPMSDREHLINEAMVRRNKHVFFADRLQECVHEHVSYQRQKGQNEPLAAQRLFVIYDNVEASEPGDTSDYSAVLDAPFYKLRIEDCKEPGYVKLKKLEVLESTLHKETIIVDEIKMNSDDSMYSESEKESIDSDESPYVRKGEDLLKKIKSKIAEPQESHTLPNNVKINTPAEEFTNGRRPSGPTKQISSQAAKANISNINDLWKAPALCEEYGGEIENNFTDKNEIQDESETKPRKSILKNPKRLSQVRKLKSKNTYTHNDETPSGYRDISMGDETETSGYRSNSSSRHNESSETESDYGYSTITQATTPKKIELRMQSNYMLASGVLPEESWTQLESRDLDGWSDDEDESKNDTSSKLSLTRNLYERHYYLNSSGFMSNFVDNFIINLGSGLGMTPEAISNALTQGASVYCDSLRNGSKVGYEIYPALLAAWPNAANQWIIRERKIVRNPRTNYSYQWPTKYMVSKAIGFGCLLVPIGFRPKRGENPEQTLQWRIIFPAAERYLESCLAHSQMRCYLFALALQKTFMENETSKIGIDASHIKNHLFWQCEDNYARWPEDRLGESLRLFLRNFYTNFVRSRFPNYFIENCNEFKSIPKPLLLKLHRRLADILEAPVMHVLHAVDKLKYTKRDFYPPLNCQRLYEILTCKNPLRILNPNLPAVVHKYEESSESEDETLTNFWDKAKARDKQYKWAKEKQRIMGERTKILVNNKKHKPSFKQEREIKQNIILPSRMDTERRRLVLEFFISHFIAMARTSEKFDAIKQAVIYLEQAQRLCILLRDEPAGDGSAVEYLNVIHDKLVDCQRKLVKQGGYKLPPRRESKLDRSVNNPIRKQRPKFENIVNHDSPVENPSISAFAFVDVHMDSSSAHEDKNNVRLNDIIHGEESKL